MLSALLFLLIGGVLLCKPSLLASHSAASAHFQHSTLFVLKLQLCTLLLSAAVTRSSALSLAAKRGLPLLNQVLAWLILRAFASPRRISHRSSCLFALLHPPRRQS
jgi:phosphatidylinositol glycan class N